MLPTGTWALFLPVTPPVPLWHEAQLVAAPKVLWSTLPADQVLVDLWQPSQVVCPVCVALLGLMLAWQVAHCVVMLALLWTLAPVQTA